MTRRELRPDEHICFVVETMFPEGKEEPKFLYLGERGDMARERNDWTFVYDYSLF